MKHKWFVRGLALIVALMLAVSGLAMAEEEIVAEPVEEIGQIEGEWAFGLNEAEATEEEAAEAPAGEEGEPLEDAGMPEGAVFAASMAISSAEESAATPGAVPADDPAIAGDAGGDAMDPIEGEAVPAPQQYTSDPIGRNARWSLNVGDTLQLVMAKTPKAYKSSKPKVASVSAGGLVTAKKAGKAKITAKLSGKKKIVITVTVKDPCAPTGVAIDNAPGTIYIGMGTPRLTARLEPGYARTTLKWKSSNRKVLRVSADGVLTPVKAGTAKITVTTGNKKKAAVKLTVKKNLIVMNAKPTKPQISSVLEGFRIGVKSVERKADGAYEIQWYLCNNFAESRKITNLGRALWINGVKVAEKVWPAIRVVSKKGTAKVFRTTYSAQDLLVKDAFLLAELSRSDVSLEPIPDCEYSILYKK